MEQRLCSVEEAGRLIESGSPLLIAGDEALLKKLPAGAWIGGTIPYFVGQEGGQCTNELVFVTVLPDYAKDITINVYDKQSLRTVYVDGPENGFSFIIIPGMSETHFSFALNAPGYPTFATSPLIGWIAGVNLDMLGHETPKIVNGQSLHMLEDGAVVMHVSLPPGKTADVGIINIFRQGEGVDLQFDQSGFSVREASVDGKTVDFAKYIESNEIDTKLPLVADYAGAMINTSFQKVDTQENEVKFYSPVFEGARYRLAAPTLSYTEEFRSQVPARLEGQVIFSCNCILNYLYSELEGKKTGEFVGPITFGEIAYQLVNQTLVYLQVIDT